LGLLRGLLAFVPLLDAVADSDGDDHTTDAGGNERDFRETLDSHPDRRVLRIEQVAAHFSAFVSLCRTNGPTSQPDCMMVVKSACFGIGFFGLATKRRSAPVRLSILVSRTNPSEVVTTWYWTLCSHLPSIEL